MHTAMPWDNSTVASCQQFTLLPLGHNLQRLLVWGDGDKLKCRLCAIYASLMRHFLCMGLLAMCSRQSVCGVQVAACKRFFGWPVQRILPQVPCGAIAF